MNKKINLPLILITITIWGLILYNFADAIWLKQNDAIIENKIENSFSDKRDKPFPIKMFEYEILDQDPFGRKSAAIVNDRREPIQTELPIINNYDRINFGVTGIVINGENKNIVLNDETNSKIVFLKEGDIYQGLKIHRVSKQQVELVHILSGEKIISHLK
ncbi:MAG: hypothetical protein IPM56_03205 [Ignavibacteriales bacterium]|nr:MAG: hypothetical protein IPM56_03205 [Ignavibacteriales bacterium]